MVAVGSALEALEAALDESPDREHLLVYADALQARGDPRGELIALDLHIEAEGTTPELDAHRHELMVRWLGEDLARDPSIRHSRGRLEVGPVSGTSAQDDALLARVFNAGIAAPTRLTLHADGNRIASALAHVSLAVRPWLTHLAIALRGRAPALPRKLTTAVIDATPRLYELDVDGRIFGGFPHPALRRLRIVGYDSLTLAGPNLAMPALTDLDLRLVSGGRSLTNAPAERAALAALLPSTGLPALARLDLTRNEPGVTMTPKGETSIFRFLRELPIRAQLTHVRLPSLRSLGDVANTQAALETMPRLVELEISRVYRGLENTFHHPTARLRVRDQVPWPPPEQLVWAVAIEIAGMDQEQVIDLRALIQLMERAYTTLPAEARVAWGQLWRCLDGLVEHDRAARVRVPFPLAVLEQALTSCEQTLVNHAYAGSRLLQIGNVVRHRARVLPADAKVMMRREIVP